MTTTRRRLAGAAVVAAALLGACGTSSGPGPGAVSEAAAEATAQAAAGAAVGDPGRPGDGSMISATRRPAADTPSTATPTRHVGPQGRVGQFVAICRYSHSGPNDPIVHPDHTGASHLHDFYGATTIDASTTPADLLASDTTCNKRADRAGYWHPTLYDHGEAVEPLEISAYYRAAPGVEPTAVQTMPLGLALIAGDFTASEPQPGEAVGWTCGTRSTLSAEPPVCPSGAPLHLVLTFQDCWDGVHLDSDDHAAHVDYSTDGACPDTHPVHIPQLTMSVRFPIWGEGRDLTLSSGSVYSAHGDFFNGWEPDALQREIEMCIHRDVVCNLASNRREEPLFGAGN